MYRLKLSIAFLSCIVFGLLAVAPSRIGRASEDREAASASSPADDSPSGDLVRNKGQDLETGKVEAEKSMTRALVASLTIFVLAIFVGFEVITKVPPTLHTPLMSGSNAISGITIVGALIASSRLDNEFLATLLAAMAVAFAMINVVGGYLVTDRMLEMFKSRKKSGGNRES